MILQCSFFFGSCSCFVFRDDLPGIEKQLFSAADARMLLKIRRCVGWREIREIMIAVHLTLVIKVDTGVCFSFIQKDRKSEEAEQTRERQR